MVKFRVKILEIFFISLLSACGGCSDNKKTEVLENQAPVAVIDLDEASIVLNNSVTISGSSSNDPDGDLLSYEWSIKTAAGDDYLLVDKTAETFVFTPEDFGSYEVTLVVRDNLLISAHVTSSITVSPNEQSYPIAMVSDDISSKIGNVNWFSAESSTASDGQVLTYSWEIKSQPSESNSVIGDATKLKGYLITDVAGTYKVSLTVTNVENKLTATEVLTIQADELLVNSAPVAIISTPLPSYAPDQIIRLDATASYDSDHTDLKYQWRIEIPTPESYLPLLSGDTTKYVEFTVVGLGDYQIILEVTDGLLFSETKQAITITNQNIAPVANAGSDQEVTMGLVLELDGSGSSDSDGETDDLTYQWSLVSKPSSSSYDHLANPSFSSSDTFDFIADTVGEYVLALQAFDGIDYSVVDHVYIEVADNQRPVAILPDDVIVHRDNAHTIPDTKSYDPEDQPLSYQWEMVSVPTNSTGRVLSPSDLSAAIVMTDLPGTYTVQLIVNDGIQDSFPATMSFIYTPEEFYEVTVLGRLIDEGGLPLAIAEIGGILHAKEASDDNGNFEVLLKSRNKDASLTVLTIVDENILATILRVAETDEEQIDLGTIKLPVLQRKDVTLTACQGYSGAEKVIVNFYLSTDGYENMKFLKPVVAELTLDQEPQEVKLPAQGTINMRLATSASGQIYADDGKTFFTHEYQVDDSQNDSLEITVCN